MTIDLRSPKDERASIPLPQAVSQLRTAFNGTICSKAGDEYPIRNNIVDLLANIEIGKDISFAQSTNHWKVTAGVYEDLWRKRSLSILTGEEFPVEKERELLIHWLQPSPGGLYLDIGCSTALYSRMIKKAEPESTVVAMDFSMPMLEEARLKAEAEQADIYLIRADARDMPFFGKSFDGLMMGGTLNELGDSLKVLFESKRVIKPGGIFFMMHLVKSDYWYGRLIQDSAEWGGLSFPSVSESNDLFSRAGFAVTDQFVKGIVCFSKLIPA